MAGIGFALRRLNPNQSFLGLLRVYGIAGIISSGPWLLSIGGIILIGVFSLERARNPREVVQFQVSVTYLFASTLVLTGFLQLLFTRFVADRLFEKREDMVLPNLVGCISFTTGLSGLLGIIAAVTLFPEESMMYRVLMVSGFVLLSGIWMFVVLLTGLKAYKTVLLMFAIGYGTTVAAALSLVPYGLEGLLAGFVFGHGILYFLLFSLLLRSYPADRFVSFDFMKRELIFPSLAFTGLFYNIGIWVDKFLFWMNEDTSEQVIGPLRGSTVYDVPIFLAYLTIVPGMAVFLVRMETDFAELYDAFYDAVRQGATLEYLERTRDNMVSTVRQGIYEIFKVQGITFIILLVLGPQLLELIGISQLYLDLFYVDAAAVTAQVVLLAILNVVFYLDLRKIAVLLCVLFVLANIALTLLTQILGPPFFGYGFAISLGITVLVGLSILSNKMDRLVSDTFMLQTVKTG